jgi:hypothetical protein
MNPPHLLLPTRTSVPRVERDAPATSRGHPALQHPVTRINRLMPNL